MSPPSENIPTTQKNTDEGRGYMGFNRILLKAKYSLYSALVFFLFANPETSFILQRAFGKFVDIITPSGAMTVSGIFINTGLFFITMLGLMLLPSD
jgi:hypothetical protein